MTVVKSAPPVRSLFRSKAPSLTDLGVILEHNNDAALIIDQEHGLVVFSNSAFNNLTAFSSSDLPGMKFQDLLDDAPGAAFELGEALAVHLRRKNRPSLVQQLKLHPVDANGQWLLAIFTSPQALNQTNWYVTLLKGASQLSHINEQPSLQAALEIAVELIHSLLHIELAGIYQADSEFPRLVLAASHDTAGYLPDTLPSTDLIRLSNPAFWQHGKRVTTDLYRIARINGLGYVASAPLGSRSAMVGLVVLAERGNEPPHENLMEVLPVVVDIISSSIQHFILSTNLGRVIDEQQRLVNLYQILIEHIQEGVIIASPDLRVVSMNQIAEGMFGYIESEVKGQPVESILIGSERLQPAFKDAILGVATYGLGQTNLHRRKGQTFPAEIIFLPVMNNEHVESVLIQVTDISENVENKVRRQELEQRAIIGEVSYMFAHEIRNPINNIVLTSEVMASRIPANDPNQESLQRLQADCQRLTHLVEMILSSSKPLDPKLEEMNLVSFLRKMMERWRPRLMKAHVEPLFTSDADTRIVMGDPRSLEQVFTNIITNAVEAMDKQNGGHLAFKVMTRNVGLNLTEVVATITDDGPGIPDDLLEKVFEPFVTNKPRGTGLGLAISKQIISAHKGSIRAFTFPGGTTFEVALPAIKKEVKD